MRLNMEKPVVLLGHRSRLEPHAPELSHPKRDWDGADGLWRPLVEVGVCGRCGRCEVLGPDRVNVVANVGQVKPTPTEIGACEIGAVEDGPVEVDCSLTRRPLLPRWRSSGTAQWRQLKPPHRYVVGFPAGYFALRPSVLHPLGRVADRESVAEPGVAVHELSSASAGVMSSFHQGRLQLALMQPAGR
jgi:hypothetical protein